MKDEVFADTVGEITLGGSVVRIDLVSQARAPRTADGKPVMEFRQRVVMPLEGFVRTAKAFDQTLAKLREAGIVRATPEAERTEAVAEPTAG